MLGWLWRMLVGRFTSCRHKWAAISEAKIVRDGKHIGNATVLRCEHCGDLKNHHVFIVPEWF